MAGVPQTPPQERIPTSVVAPLIDRWLEVYKTDHSEMGKNQNSSSYITEGSEKGHLDILAFQCGVSSRRLRLIKDNRFDVGSARHGTLRYVDWLPFDIADKIVIATVGPMAWHHEPLCRYYGPLGTKPWERKLQEEAA